MYAAADEPTCLSVWRVLGNLAVILLVGLAAADTSQAAKPRDPAGEFIGNGFPSGPHFNLILNAKAHHDESQAHVGARAY